MVDTFKIFAGSAHYENYLNSFTCERKLTVDLDRTDISEAIFFHLCKIRYAEWKHMINFSRHRSHTISDIFQDIVAFYIKAALPKEFSVELEKREGTTQPDIIIKKNGNYEFLIEIKTSIGYERPNMNHSDPYENFRKRVKNLSNNFSVPEQKIIYVFESHSNVNAKFSENFWDKHQNKAKKVRPTEFPLSIIFPLFNSSNPYYWKYDKGFDKTKEYKEITDAEFMEKAKRNIVTPIEEVIKLIQKV